MTPAGAPSQIQYNAGAVLGASPNLTFDGTSLVAPSLKIPRETVQTDSANAFAYTIQLDLANNLKLTLNTNVNSLRFSGYPPSGICFRFRLFVTQGDPGGFNITWPASMNWGTASPPTLTGNTGLTDIFEMLTLDGGTTWYSVVIGQGF
jgi:hypothetical protein